MIVEILGAKMLAPYLGTSHFVWTAQITVTLLALASGYYLGGRWVDRSPQLRPLYLGILGAALYLCAAVTQVERVAYACLALKLATGSLLASVALFFVPLALLATVGPFLVRFLTQSVQSVGGSVGRLTAVSTLGSVAGTVLIGYVLIPLLPNSVTMIVTAGVLMIVAAVYLLVWGRSTKAKWTALVALAVCIGCGLAEHSRGLWVSARHRELYRGNSNFGQLQVIEARDAPQRFLLNDYLEQGTYDIAAQQSLALFTYMLHDLARAYTTNPGDVLCIGLGVGIVPMQFAREGARVDVVEINPAVVPLARQYFGLQPERLNLTFGDGRLFVNQSRKRYDAIILDAFLGDSSPSHLLTREALTAMRRRLQPGGVLVINCFGDFEPGRDFLVASLQKTLREVFSSVRAHSDLDPGQIVNVFFVASASELVIRRAPAFGDVHPFCREKVKAVFAREVAADPAQGIVLRDDYNPVEYYDAANRERFRRELALSVRALDPPR